jgi:opacity protein-like surface antigen
MKKGVLVCAAVLVLAVLIAAPASAATKFNFGLKAGASSSNVKWSDDVGDEKSVTELTFGGFVIFELSPTLAIQPEINYLVTGEQWDITEGTNVENFTYLHIPILLRARLMKEGKFVPVVFAGPAVGFLLSAKDGGEDVKEWFKSTDFGLDLGLGAEIALGTMKALLDFRYYMGLTNVYSAPDLVIMELPMDFTMKNAAFMLTAGIIF